MILPLVILLAALALSGAAYILLDGDSTVELIDSILRLLVK